MPHYTLNYRFESQPRSHTLNLNDPQLSQADAIRHLIELHHGDAENGLLMPDAQASEAEVLEKAAVLGITAVSVTA